MEADLKYGIKQSRRATLKGPSGSIDGKNVPIKKYFCWGAYLTIGRRAGTIDKL